MTQSLLFLQESVILIKCSMGCCKPLVKYKISEKVDPKKMFSAFSLFLWKSKFLEVLTLLFLLISCLDFDFHIIKAVGILYKLCNYSATTFENHNPQNRIRWLRKAMKQYRWYLFFWWVFKDKPYITEDKRLLVPSTLRNTLNR